MDFRTSEQQDILRRTVRGFAETEIRPHVMVWDEARRGPAWSEPAYFTMGLLSAADWEGKWIGKEESCVRNYLSPRAPC